MSGLRGPSDYSQEPLRHPSLRINAKEPFNAEPTREDLISSYITPVDFFYKRNHGPIPIVDDINSYYLSIGGLVEKPKKLSLDDIKKLPKYNVTATLQCAGNRRTAMSKIRAVRGVGWDVATLGNAIWGGAKLSDLLELVGVSHHTAITSLGGKHAEFTSIDQCPEENGGPYKASIPLDQATNPAADVLLAYEMNGEVLNRDHGYPLRVIVPGVIGARSVKWLDRIDIIEEESQGFFMQKDYKMFPPSVDWDNIDWSTRKPQMDFPVQALAKVSIGPGIGDQSMRRIVGRGKKVVKRVAWADEVGDALEEIKSYSFEEDATVAGLGKSSLSELKGGVNAEAQRGGVIEEDYSPTASVQSQSCPNSATRGVRRFVYQSNSRRFRCLAPDHKVAECRDPVRCLRCRKSGHRTLFCKETV
uniref:Oxidoreductase molybdopterin-binding domain-containing protein n=1 Tax=Ananas comosus var. bracteatus TaxID=296719 RepID=A0A6V7NNU1_ANACO|nr:unnamed protein product [Ananas comosus var. bracteatus]